MLTSSISYPLDKFLLLHVIAPFFLFGSIFIGFESSGLDLWLSRHFYDVQTQAWPWRDHWLTKTVLHDAGQKLSIILGILVFFTWLVSLRHLNWKRFSRHLLFLFMASVSGPLLIAIFKNTTHIYCPWSLSLFGGDKPYIRLFDFAHYPLEVGHCFPAGHAGGGYAFLSLYFFLWMIKPAYRFHGLFIGLLIGFVFGATQQMRGAHFFSHDISALAICWFSSLILFVLFFRKQVQWS
jgi:membrane-associated PAP2 superfamily phosphatase